MNISIYTDGSCVNPGIGGYAAILSCNKDERVVKGHTLETVTNNRMELQAVVSAVEWVNRNQKKPCELTVYTDSNYILNCAYGKNKDGSKRTGAWFNGRANKDLWFQLITEVRKGKHMVKFVKVQASDELNNRADALAKAELVAAKHELLRKKV